MADKGEFTSKPLGPEWLTSFSKDSQFDGTIDDSGRQGPNTTGRRVFFPDKVKPRVPLEMLGRSKSSPVLTQETTVPTIPKEVDVFTLLKEKNSFDKNFPTLNTRKPTTQPTTAQPSNPTSIGSEKELQTVWKPPTATRASSASQLPINTINQPVESKDKKPPSEEKEVDNKTAQVPIHSVLPVPVPAKPRNKVELVSPKKPAPSLKPLPPDSHSPKNRRFDPSLLRKACSEPNLPLNMVDAANYEIKLMPPKARPPSNLSSNRNDFFQNLIKKEQQRSVSFAPNQPSQNDQNTSSQHGTSTESESKTQIDNDNNFRGDEHPAEDTVHTKPADDELDNTTEKQCKNYVSEEDEERFLRDLGWVPEEESHVPELTDEEILEVKKRLGGMERQSTKLALDISVKKWQHDKFFTPLSLSSVDAST
mmetsp:Transcript_21708/g.30376  ORF Transcript_21708/g.30376 Transcript_21708/m.30376 type:complete len:422 (-) Transcript_21708:52-1317(-)